jgi:hypothetical protein
MRNTELLLNLIKSIQENARNNMFFPTDPLAFKRGFPLALSQTRKLYCANWQKHINLEDFTRYNAFLSLNTVKCIKCTVRTDKNA